MDMEEHNSDSFSIGSVCFSFSEGSGPESIYEEGIKDEAGEMFLREEGEEVDVVTTGGFFSDKDGVFREGGEPFGEVFETFCRHREGGFKEDFLWVKECTGGEGVFGDINPNKDIKVSVLHNSTSRNKAGAGGACQPILHGDEGLIALPTYHGLGRQATNSFEGSLAQVKWSCPALPSLIYMGKTHSYKSYNINFS